MAIFPEAIQFRIVAAELCLKSGDESAAASYYLEILEVDSLNIFCTDKFDRLLPAGGGF